MFVAGFFSPNYCIIKEKRVYFPNPNFFCCPPIVCDSTDPGDAENTKEIFSGMFPKGAGPMCQTNTVNPPSQAALY